MQLIVYIHFQDNIINELLRYRAIHEVEKIKFFDFLVLMMNSNIYSMRLNLGRRYPKKKELQR